MPLKVVARLRCSALPSTFARTVRSPSATRRGGVVEPPQRAGDLARDHDARGEAEPEHEQRRSRPGRASRGRVARETASTLWVTRTAPTRVPRSTTGTAVARISWSSVSLRRRSWTGLPRCSACAISGPVAVVGAEPVRARGVGQQRALAVGDHDAAADGRGRGLDRPVERAAGRVEVAGDGGGDDVGLRARLRADLGVDAVAQADRERDLERDDREQQDVRERQQQAPAQGHSHSSGAVKRKPTPRTVCR